MHEISELLDRGEESPSKKSIQNTDTVSEKSRDIVSNILQAEDFALEWFSKQREDLDRVLAESKEKPEKKEIAISIYHKMKQRFIIGVVKGKLPLGSRKKIKDMLCEAYTSLKLPYNHDPKFDIFCFYTGDFHCLDGDYIDTRMASIKQVHKFIQNGGDKIAPLDFCEKFDKIIF